MDKIGNLINGMYVGQRLQNDGSDRSLLRASGVSTYSGP